MFFTTFIYNLRWCVSRKVRWISSNQIDKINMEFVRFFAMLFTPVCINYFQFCSFTSVWNSAHCLEMHRKKKFQNGRKNSILNRIIHVFLHSIQEAKHYITLQNLSFWLILKLRISSQRKTIYSWASIYRMTMRKTGNHFVNATLSKVFF